MKKSIFSLILVSTLSSIPIHGALADIATRMDTVVVTASRIAQHNYKITGNVTVLTQEDITASNAQTIPELLAGTEGINLYHYSTSKNTSIDIRGFGDTASRNILVLVDDRRINPIDMSAPDLLQIPLEAVDRIEIIRGAGSVLYGDNAVGGVINIITKKGKGELSGSIGGHYGSYDRQGSHAHVSGEFKDVSYYFSGKYNDDRGYRDNSDVLAQDFNARLGYNFTETVGIDINTGWHEDNYGLPGGLSLAQIQTLGPRASTAESDAASTKDRFINIGFDLTPWPEDGYIGNLAIDLYYRNRDVYDEFNAFAGFETHTKRSTDTQGVTAKYIFDRTIFDREVNFVTGFDYYDHENDILGSATTATDLTISKEEKGVYGFLQYELLDKLFINGGTRYQEAEYAFSQRDVARDEKQRPDDLVSMGGLKYEYGKGSNLHFNVQQTFRFLTTDEWYNSANFPAFGITPNLNTGLEQQRGIQFEAGVRHNFNDAVLVNVTPYMMRMKHEIFLDPATFLNSNYPATRRIGVEFSSEVDVLKFMDVDFLDKLAFLSNFTWQDPQFEDGANAGKDIPLVPRYQARGGLSSEFLDHYIFSITGNYVGSRYTINDVSNGELHGTSPMKPYYTLDAKLAYRNKNLEVYGGVNNITDKEYSLVGIKSAFGADMVFYPAPERNYNVGVNLKF